ncbi:PLC-like phosphodiesterase [Polychytrium aggregatum]|uniref:PLC-like phosphodiesterase n=1 Tax=Polychytrium aggregatum TaxID=110093 RepID=UPI0022FE3D55|nr:PLC-like phosphodiesterase [Polychytrium aggregatum]KAI9203321.1 PLC-like phosphodiesterase [Polychytrium aggregatum]
MSRRAATQIGLLFAHDLMSHRGGSLERVENTLAAFRYSAQQLKVPLLELDVQLTRDGQVVIFHDQNMERLTGIPNVRIQDYDYADLPPLLVRKELANVPGLTQERDATRIPLLEELLKEFPKYPMQIDVKTGPEELVVKVGRLLRKYERENVTVWGSFRHPVNSCCHHHFPDIPLFFSFQRALTSFALYHLGLGWIMTYYESALILPDMWLFLRPGWFRYLNRHGISVIVFGSGSGSINDVAGWERVRAAGVNGICSDRPSLLQEWLETHPLAGVSDVRKQD